MVRIPSLFLETILTEIFAGPLSSTAAPTSPRKSLEDRLLEFPHLSGRSALTSAIASVFRPIGQYFGFTVFPGDDPAVQGELKLAARFIERCFTVDPAARPTATELLQDEWFHSST
jgi:serine/threonine protein kinase